MYCRKCLCPKGLNSDRKSCRVNSSEVNTGENTYHDWVPNYIYYIQKCVEKYLL